MKLSSAKIAAILSRGDELTHRGKGAATLLLLFSLNTHLGNSEKKRWQTARNRRGMPAKESPRVFTSFYESGVRVQAATGWVTLAAQTRNFARSYGY